MGTTGQGVGTDVIGSRIRTGVGDTTPTPRRRVTGGDGRGRP